MDRRTEINWTDAATNTLRGFSMAYDNASMITNVTRETCLSAGRPQHSRVYGYDSIDRLVSERHYDTGGALTWSAEYEYDLAGNRTRTVSNGVTNIYMLGAGDRLASWGRNGENTVSYDDAGNATQRVVAGQPMRDLEWDIQYRLTSVSTNGTPVESCQYDVTDRRIATRSGTNVVWHVCDGMRVIADTDGNGNLLRSYTWDPGMDHLLALTVHPTSTNATASTFHALTDHLGTVHAFAGESGNIVESCDYDAWGNALGVHDATGTPIPASSIGNRFLFQGREYSWVTGLYNFRARWHDPFTGRRLSNDPIGIAGGLNQCVASGNNPAMFVDSPGLAIVVRDPAQRAVVLATLSKFARGTLSFDDKGHLQRAGSADDRDIEGDADSLIADKRAHEIVDEGRGWGGAAFEPWSQVGGDLLWQDDQMGRHT